MSFIERVFGFGKLKFEKEPPKLGEVYGDMLRIAWPATVEGVLMSVIGSIDTMMVGTLGKEAIAAVGVTTQPRMILLIFAQALCVGTTALIARRKGEGDRAAANSVMQQSMMIMAMLAIIVSLLGFFFARPFMNFAGANDDTRELAVSYFKVISCGFILNYFSLCLCASMRAIGQTRITMVSNMLANIVNVILNYCLIGGHFGFPALGVRGAAIATVCGTAVGCVAVFIFAMNPNGYLRFRFRLQRFDKRTISGLIKVGSSSMAESVFLRLGFLINAKLIAGIGTAEMAAYQVVQQVTALSFTLGDGLATSGATLVGQALGAKDADRARANVTAVRKLSIVASLMLMLLILIFCRQLPKLFTDDEAIIAGATLSFIVVTTGIIPQNGRVVYSGCLRGAGDVKYVAMCSLISVAVIRPILTYVFCYPLNSAFPALSLAMVGPWVSFVLDAFIRNGMLAHRVRKGKWLTIKL